MKKPSLEVVLLRLSEWRAETVARLRTDHPSALDLKLALDAAIRWLEVCERTRFTAGSQILSLPIPDEYEPFGDYRIMWDCETEDRHQWREVARASPEDLLIRLELKCAPEVRPAG